MIFHTIINGIFIEVQLISNVVLVSGIQQSDSVLYIYIIFQITFHYNKILNIVPRAIQQDFVIYLFFTEWFVSANPKLLNYSPLSPLITVNLFSMSVSLFLFCKHIHNTFICIIFLDSTSKQCHMIFVFLSLACFTQYDNLQFLPCCCIWHYFILYYD